MKVNIRNGLIKSALFVCLVFTAQTNAQIIGSNLETTLLNEENKTISTPRLGAQFTINSPSQYKLGAVLDQDNYSAGAEYWSKGNWGLSGKIEENDLSLLGVPKESESARIDVNRKLLSSTKSNSYLAFGLGLQSVNVSDVIDAEGLRFSLLGKLALSENVLFYGNGGLFQSFDESVDDSQVSGYSFEAGLNYQVGSKFSLSAGLKVQDLEDEQLNRRSQTSSFLIGTHLAF
jgi:hypothetical protein